MLEQGGASNSKEDNVASVVAPWVRMCAAHGFFVSFSAEFRGRQRPVCPVCVPSAPSKAKNGAALHHIKGRGVIGGVIPDHLKGATLPEFPLTHESQYRSLGYSQTFISRWAVDDLEECGQLLFLGESGSGKSYVALALLESLSATKIVHYVDVNAGCPPIPEIVDVLVLDNLFCNPMSLSEHGKRYWNKVILERAVAERPTIMVSNVPKTAIRSALSSRTLHWLRMNNTKIVYFERAYETD